MQALRSLVSGPKNKTIFNNQQLDLTYITQNIIAMAYPASSIIQKTYRNPIDQVYQYFQKHHKNKYLIINVSGRRYDYSLFQNRVVQYPWNDHQAPMIDVLVDIAWKIKEYLQRIKDGVVAVHCNHGKGRTGTAIISVLMYIGMFKNAQEALVFYNGKRFSNETYGVDQPCQTRYLSFFQQIMKIRILPKKLIAYRLTGVTHQKLNDKYYLTIKQVRNNSILVDRLNFNKIAEKSYLPLLGDIFIQIYQSGWTGEKRLIRINYHTYFIHPTTDLSIKSLSKEKIPLNFQGKNLKCSSSIKDKDFNLVLWFDYYCLCHLQDEIEVQCQCKEIRKKEESEWRMMGVKLEKAAWRGEGEEEQGEVEEEKEFDLSKMRSLVKSLDDDLLPSSKFDK